MTETQRYPAFDALRAIAMELGLVLHAAVPYTQGCPPSWVVCDPSRSGLFDLANTLIHAARMPVFFLMSGFFAALLWERVGPGAFVLHRLRRIALPFGVATLVLVPLTRAVWIWGAFARPVDPVVGNFSASLAAHFREKGAEVYETIWHLWFLEYLAIFTLCFVAVRWTADRGMAGTLPSRVGGAFVGRARALWLWLPTAVAMLAMGGWNVDGVSELRPSLHLLGYYGIFFVVGTLLFAHREQLVRLEHAWQAHLAVALALILPALMALSRLQATSPAPAIDLAGRALSAALTCALLFGAVGFFLARFADPNPRQRYLADAAYFLYLVHFPLTAVLGVWIAPLGLPALVKFALVLALAFPLLLAVYHGGVRYRAIGRVLHGPRKRPARVSS